MQLCKLPSCYREKLYRCISGDHKTLLLAGSCRLDNFLFYVLVQLHCNQVMILKEGSSCHILLQGVYI